jgi:1-aminocyclopropane-1-carboxylate deaminase/D-cysteine desulfhydrase-like pyridoxal-dependent ACC family enzyme
MDRRTFIAALAALAVSPARAQDPALERPLLRRYPRLRSLPWMDLGGLPTRVYQADPRLEAHLGHPLFIKRDDLAGEGFGGSKARKLELLLADARRQHQRVLTFGGAGSNHALATAYHARRADLDAVLVLLSEPSSDQVRRHLLAEHALGAELHAGTRRDREDGGARFGPAYVIPQGGTSALGTVGYVNAALELGDQLTTREMPDRIYVAAGTTGAAAGLYVGLRLLDVPVRLIAVRTSSRATANEARLAREIAAVVALLCATDPTFPTHGFELDPRYMTIDHGEAGPGYAIPSASGARALAIARDLGDVTLDPTYTAKAFAAAVRDRSDGGNVLFWNTYDARRVPSTSRPEDLPPALQRYFR